MSSLVSEFEYDIFISYRHNDNLPDRQAGLDGWVTDFVQNLEKELRSTLKDALTIYFDKNPHDGLLETHNVDKSLEGKLKCLIFIPIISQTYCDTKSFAWQHEFCAFNKLAKKDQFGRDIKLSNGNVASRILPIKIHDIDADDKAILENEISGVLRAIEFIYKEAGVNRPLKSTDSKSDNQNKTDYRNQINKVANAVKEIIQALKSPINKASVNLNEKPPLPNDAKKNSNKKIAFAAIGLMILFALIYAASQYMGSPEEEPEALDKSIAVLPFADMSSTKDQEYLGDGIAEEIINVLAQSQDLKVIARSSSFQFKGKNEDLRTMGKMLGVSTILEGSVRKFNNQIRVTAQLIKVSDGTHLWSKNFDQNTDDIFKIQDEIAAAIATALRATLSINTIQKNEIWNDEARRLYQLGRYLFDQGNIKGDILKALDYFEKSIKIDSSHAIVWTYLGSCHSIIGDYVQPRVEIARALLLDSLDGDALVLEAEIIAYDFDHRSASIALDKALPYAKSARAYRVVSRLMNKLGRPAEAVSYGKRAIEQDPLQAYSYAALGVAYHSLRQYDSAQMMYRRLQEIIPSAPPDVILYCHIAQHKYKEAQEELSSIQDAGWRAFYSTMINYSMGDQKASDAEFAKVRSLNPSFYYLAILHAHRQEKKEAILNLEKWFEAGVADLSLRTNGQKPVGRSGNPFMFLYLNITSDPVFDPLRSDPRYIRIIRKLNRQE